MHLWNHATKIAQKQPDYPWKIYDTLHPASRKKSVLDAYLQDESLQEVAAAVPDPKGAPGKKGGQLKNNAKPNL